MASVPAVECFDQNAVSECLHESVTRRVCVVNRLLNVRELMSGPSIDCLLRRAKMRYVSRLVICSPPALCALLGARPGGNLMPRAALFVHDFEWSRCNSFKAQIRSRPLTHPDVWTTSIRDKEWCEVVARSFFFTSSCVDPCRGRSMGQIVLPVQVSPFSLGRLLYSSHTSETAP